MTFGDRPAYSGYSTEAAVKNATIAFDLAHGGVDYFSDLPPAYNQGLRTALPLDPERRNDRASHRVMTESLRPTAHTMP